MRYTYLAFALPARRLSAPVCGVASYPYPDYRSRYGGAPVGYPGQRDAASPAPRDAGPALRSHARNAHAHGPAAVLEAERRLRPSACLKLRREGGPCHVARRLRFGQPLNLPLAHPVGTRGWRGALHATSEHRRVQACAEGGRAVRARVQRNVRHAARVRTQHVPGALVQRLQRGQLRGAAICHVDIHQMAESHP